MLAERVQKSLPDRWIPLIAEDHRNLDTMIRPRWAGGWDLDGVWADDFHHQVRRHIAGDDEGYYRDYTGTTDDLATTINQGWFYTGQHSIHLDEPRGTDPVGIEPRKFTICLQNHDQVGNRAFGDRLHHQVDPAAYRAATALLLTCPQTPLLFMGQEWAASAPFLYFTDHDEDLGKIVTEGRRREFRHFLAFVDPEAREKIPDPQAVSTFETSRLDWSELEREPHASTFRLYRALLGLRRSEPALRANAAESHEAVALDDETLMLMRWSPEGDRMLIVVRFRGEGAVDLSGHEELGIDDWVRWEARPDDGRRPVRPRPVATPGGPGRTRPLDPVRPAVGRHPPGEPGGLRIRRGAVEYRPLKGRAASVDHDGWPGLPHAGSRLHGGRDGPTRRPASIRGLPSLGRRRSEAASVPGSTVEQGSLRSGDREATITMTIRCEAA